MFFSALDALQHPGHVAGERTHDLQTLLILSDVGRRGAVYLVPILRRDNGHAINGEVLVDVIKGGTAAAAACTDHTGCRFVCKFSGTAEKQTIHKGF